MYNLPALFQTQDYLCPVPDGEMDRCVEECLFRDAVPCDSDMYELCTIIAVELDLQHPRDAHQALEVYLELWNAVHNYPEL